MKCGKPIKAAKNGVDRGSCTREMRHGGRCANGTCHDCGEQLSESCKRRRRVVCLKCRADRERTRSRARGVQPRRIQMPGQFFTFPCGCSGILPSLRRESNKLVGRSGPGSWVCRVLKILHKSVQEAEKGNHKPIALNTPHFLIRKLMDEILCWRCKQPLEWVFGNGKTPHLHHNHDTGEIYGFTHPHCNPQALEHEIDELRQRIHDLESQLNTAVAA